MLDAQILSAVLASREAYERISPHITAKELTPPIAFWYELVGEWYARDRSARSVDIDVMRANGDIRISNPKQRETILGVLSNLPVAVSADGTVSAALELKRWNVGMELAGAIAAKDSKKTAKLHSMLGDLLGATDLGTKKAAEWEDAAPIDQIFSKIGHENRIPLAPNVLNSRVSGGALPGHHIVVFARPEMGKSTFAVNFGVQLAIKGYRVLYVGNEDQINVLKARALGRANNMSAEETEANSARAIEVYKQRGVEDRLIFGQLKHGGADAIRQQIERYEPQILIVDQIRNLENEEDGMVRRMEANGIAIRNILLAYNLVGLSVTQAGSSADFKVWLDMSDLDNSKTGLPGTADLMIGIGASEEMKTRNQRALSLPKNKLSSASNSHEGLIVEIDKSRSLYK